MNKDVARYRRILKRNLRCCRAKRKELMEQFDCVLDTFLEECPMPEYIQLLEAFGPPEEMASIMIGYVSEDEEKNYERVKSLWKYLKIALIVLLAAISLYIFLVKEYTIIEIYDELMPVETIIVMGGK